MDPLYKDIIIPLVGPLVALGAVIFGLVQYRRTSKRDFIKPLREAQLDLYREACSATALVATSPRDDGAWVKSKTEFLRLYFGPLAILENSDRESEGHGLSVESAMFLFKRCMENEPQCGEFGTSLPNLSLALAHACRESLGHTWGYDLPQLKGIYHQEALAYAQKLQKFDKSRLAKEHLDGQKSA
jgi:hypothetical protein